MASQIIGFMLAMYFLVGRWSTERLDGSVDAGSIIEQPRLWIVAILVMAMFVIRSGKTGLRVRTRITSVDAAICLFLAYMILASFWAPNAELAATKAFEVGLLLAVAIMFAISRPGLVHDRVVDSFWWTIVLAGIVMAGLAILNAAGGRLYVPGGGPNTFGRNMGLMALGAAHLAARYGTKVSPISAAVMIVAVLLILMSGSRGALLSATVGVFTLLITARASMLTKFAAAAVIASAVAVLLFNTVTGEDALNVFQSRIIETTVYDRYLSARDDLWLDAIDWAKERPIVGWGLNGYRANSWTYPHNMFLEVIVEGGCIGLLLLLNVGRAWWSQIRRGRYPVPRVPVAALALAFTAAQTSGDLFDSRGVFLLLALSAPAVSSLDRARSRQQTVAPQLPRQLRKTGTAVAQRGRISHLSR